MLVLDTEYINAVSYAARYNSPGEAEWPPHPDRLFMALVDAWGAAGRTEEGADALRWLEMQGPPDIAAPPVTMRRSFRSFVPVSSNGASGQDYLDGRAPISQISRSVVRKDRTFPAALLPDDRTVVSMVWRRAEPDAAVLEALNGLASRVSHVGHSASLARVSASTRQDVAEASHVPAGASGRDGADSVSMDMTDAGGVEGRAASDVAMLRCPRTGRFNTLVAEYDSAARRKAGLWPTAAPTRMYTAPPVPVHDSVMGPPEEWVVLSVPTAAAAGRRRRGGGRGGKGKVSCNGGREAPSLRAFSAVAKAMRGAVMSYADDPVHEIISGHASDGSPSVRPHMAVVPLANVGWGRRYSDGRLMGLALVLPRESGYGTLERYQLRRAVAGFLGMDNGKDEEEGRLRLGRFGTMALRDGSTSDRKSLLPDRYTAVSRVWASVTPVVLDRRLKKKNGAPDEVADCCARAGLPRPAHVRVSAHSRVAGAPGVIGHKTRVGWRPPKPGMFDDIFVLHAVLEFDEAVRGPVLVGAGRYYGMGLFMPHGGRADEGVWAA